MKNNWTMDDYQSIQDSYHISWIGIGIIIVLLIGILMILYKFNFQVYEPVTLVKNNQEFLLIVDSRKISEIESNPYIYINQKKYQFDIRMVEDDYKNVENIIYQTIHIAPYNYQTDSILIEGYFLKKNQSIYQMMIEFIKGGRK